MSMDDARAGRRRQGARTAAANRSARKCPRCLRKAALGSKVELGDRMGFVRVCDYCGHEVGVVLGVSYGRDVVPEPGVRGGRLMPEDAEPGAAS